MRCYIETQIPVRFHKLFFSSITRDRRPLCAINYRVQIAVYNFLHSFFFFRLEKIFYLNIFPIMIRRSVFVSWQVCWTPRGSQYCGMKLLCHPSIALDFVSSPRLNCSAIAFRQSRIELECCNDAHVIPSLLTRALIKFSTGNVARTIIGWCSDIGKTKVVRRLKKKKTNSRTY